jgi:hypothetical protein
MKSQYLIIFILLLTVSLSAQEIAKMPDRDSSAIIRISHDYFQEFDSIKGNPKLIIEESFGRFKKRGYSESKLSKWETTYYFSKKNLIDRKTSSYKGKIRGDWLYKYDEKGNEISEIINYGEHKGKSIERKIIYDSQERIESIKTYYTTGEIMYWESDFIYSANGDTVSYCTSLPVYRKQDTIFSRRLEVLDSLNRTIERQHFNSTGLMTTKWKFTYDKYGNLESFCSQYRDSKDTEFSKPDWWIFEYEYDDLGNWIFKYQLIGEKRIPRTKRKIEY